MPGAPMGYYSTNNTSNDNRDHATIYSRSEITFQKLIAVGADGIEFSGRWSLSKD